MSDRHFYLMDLLTVGVASELRLNGVPIATDAEGKGILISKTVNIWLLPSGNRVRLTLRWPEAAGAYSRDRSRLRLRVFRAAEGSAPPEIVETYVERRWHAPEEPTIGDPSALPECLDIPFEVPRPPLCEVFARAAPLPASGELSPEDRSEILAAVERLRAAIMDSRFEDAYELCRARYEDEAQAKNHARDRLRAGAIKTWQLLRKTPGLEAPPLVEGDARFRLYPETRLVEPVRASGDHALLFPAPSGSSRLRLMLAKLDGRWVVGR